MSPAGPQIRWKSDQRSHILESGGRQAGPSQPTFSRLKHYSMSRWSIFFPSIKAKGPRNEASFPSSLAFFTSGHSFSLANLSSGDRASDSRSLLSRRNRHPFAHFHTASRMRRSANRIMMDLWGVWGPSCFLGPTRWTMSTPSSRYSHSPGATFPITSMDSFLVSSLVSSFILCSLGAQLQLYRLQSATPALRILFSFFWFSTSSCVVFNISL